MKVGSLFSGIGGLDLGLERAGMSVVWQCELDPYARAVLKKHWPDVPCYGDVRELESPEPVDLICGGFPCQPVSQAGEKRVQADERWLWPDFARLVRVLRPRYVLVENVPGLLARGMGVVLGDLAALGFDAEWESVPAEAFGAPHRRDRVFIVAYPADSGLEGIFQLGRTGEKGEAGQPSRGGRALAHPEGERGELRATTGQRSGRPASGGAAALAYTEGVTERAGLCESEPSEQRGRRSGDECGEGHAWTTEPDVGRVAHGVPARVDRLRALGNAVVPQVAEWIGRRIMNAAYPPQGTEQ